MIFISRWLTQNKNWRVLKTYSIAPSTDQYGAHVTTWYSASYNIAKNYGCKWDDKLLNVKKYRRLGVPELVYHRWFGEWHLQIKRW